MPELPKKVPNFLLDQINLILKAAMNSCSLGPHSYFLSASIRKYSNVLQLFTTVKAHSIRPEPFGSERLDMSSSTCLKAELLTAEGSTKS